jgi:hypothetical protein
MSARKMTEVSVAVKSEAGELAHVLGVVSQAGADIVAYCGYEHDDEGGGATILVVPDKPDKAEAALRKAGYTLTTHPVVAVSGAAGPGMGARLAERIARAGINILHSYASSHGSGESTAIFRVLKPDQAVRALKS